MFDEEKRFIPPTLILSTSFKIKLNRASVSSVNFSLKGLPQVLAKLLALCWINNDLASHFLSNTKHFLEKINVQLPDSIFIEVKKEAKAKPSITVFQIPEGSKFKQRLFKLSLKLIANR